MSRLLFPIATMLLALACRPEDGARDTVTRANSAGEEHRALVRLVNAVPGAHPVTLVFGDRDVFSDVRYGTTTPYTTLNATVARLSLRHNGRTVPLDGSIDAPTLRRYTLVAMPDRSGVVTLRTFSEDNEVEAGQAQLRVINAAASLRNLRVGLGGHARALFASVPFGQEAGYRNLEPVNGVLEVRDEGDEDHVLTRTDVAFHPERTYTAVLGSTGPDVRIILTEDGPRTTPQP